MRRPLANWTRNNRALVAVIALLPLLLAGPAIAEKRIALVVGNSAYQNIARLDNPRNDATLMADTLSSLGFTLIGGRAQLDLDKAALDTDVQNFGRQIQGADVALFYSTLFHRRAGKRTSRVEAMTGVEAALMAPGRTPALARIVGVAGRAFWSFQAV
jgi:hypothetical protein